MNYWLMKSEPTAFSIDDLAENTQKNGEELWDGVRNYQARNYLRAMKTGDIAFFYHSNCKIPGIYGQMKIVRERVLDPTQFDPQSQYFDPKSSRAAPRWDTVTVAFSAKWPQPVTLEQLKRDALMPNRSPVFCPNFTPDSSRYFPRDLLSDFQLLRRGNRLSVLPVAGEIYNYILARVST